LCCRNDPCHCEQAISPAVEGGLLGAIEDIGRAASPNIGRAASPKPGDWCAVGDITSDKRGTGTRKNSGKLAVGLIPVRCWASIFEQAAMNCTSSGCMETEDAALIRCVKALGAFQEERATGRTLLEPIPHPWFDDAVLAFKYGEDKYTTWDWLKGMPWSVPLASGIRHAKAVLLDGEEIDGESGLPHIGHFVCNMVMLATFYNTYKEGNDFPPTEYFG